MGLALASESQGCKDDPRESVSPWMFKKLCGMRHPEFATGHQQDAYEFFSFLLEQIAREEFQGKDRISNSNFEQAFEVGFRTRFKCLQSSRVSFFINWKEVDNSQRSTYILHHKIMLFSLHAGVL